MVIGLILSWSIFPKDNIILNPSMTVGAGEQHNHILSSLILTVRQFAPRPPIRSFAIFYAEIEELTMGELQRILEFPEHWDELGLAFDRVVFTNALSQARDYRNRLIHFRDPLTED